MPPNATLPPLAAQPELGSPANPSSIGSYNFKTARGSSDGRQLEEAYRYRNSVNAEIEAHPNHDQQERKDLVKAADIFLSIADQLYSLNDSQDAKAALDTGLRCLDIALDFVPGISFAKNSVTIVTGVNPITGDKVPKAWRALLLTTLVMPSLLSGISASSLHLGAILARIGSEESNIGSRSARELEATFTETNDALAGSTRKNLDPIEDIVSKRLQPSSESALLEEERALALSSSGDQISGALRDVEVLRPSLKTGTSQAYFWSGRTDGLGGEKLAKEIAVSRGGTTLENQLQLAEVIPPVYDMGNVYSNTWWTAISQTYAQQVSGEVHVILGESLRSNAVWITHEFDALKANPNVTKIIRIGPRTRIETVIFVRNVQ